MRKKRKKYAIAAVYDTETCNLGNTAKTAHAIPILFIDNDIRDIDLKNYTPERDDNVNFYRFESEYIEQLHEYIRWGKVTGVIPIVCAYNLMFDLQPLMERLNDEFEIEVNAQSSTNVYTLDLLSRTDKIPVLRFWDTFHLDMRGLERMGEVAGLEKAVGSWNYDLVRSPYTELTEEELFYAKRDVQVIPAFLRFLLQSNDWMQQQDLGNRVLTKTSLVRQMAKREIGPQRITKADGKKITVEKMFLELCKQEMPKTYNQYGVRKASFRGGYTFTAAAYASTIQHNVVSVDVTSMHHTFINGRMLPDKFKVMQPSALLSMANTVLGTTREHVLEHYEKPFDVAFHIRCRITNIRIRKGSAFDHYGIALEPMSKFKAKQIIDGDESKQAGENAIIQGGWVDSYSKARFAFGKLYAAEEIVIHVNEIELWTMSRVYEWDSLEVIFGDGTMSFCRPPDYVTLQSNILYKLKADNKFITEHYIEGEPYPFHIPEVLPESYKNGLANGSITWADFNAYYISDTKGKFNGIYGTMAQDVYKPSYMCKGGEIGVDRATVVTAHNWKERQPESCRVLYTYGMRIVAGSRLHMVLAIETMHETFGESARVLGGDTDSMKISFDDCISDELIAKSLEVFEIASKRAIDTVMKRVRKLYPKQASTLRGVGGFTIENEGNHYVYHIELWNKCRMSVDGGNGVHITCAGLPRPRDRYHMERFAGELISNGVPTEKVLRMSLGYNVFVGNELCHTLESHRPKPTDIFHGTIIDHTGCSRFVECHESPCLYPVGRWVGETLKRDNANTVSFLKEFYGREVDTTIRYMRVDGYTIEICRETEFGMETVAMGESEWLKSYGTR